jgi:hypothetical protein
MGFQLVVRIDTRRRFYSHNVQIWHTEMPVSSALASIKGGEEPLASKGTSISFIKLPTPPHHPHSNQHSSTQLHPHHATYPSVNFLSSPVPSWMRGVTFWSLQVRRLLGEGLQYSGKKGWREEGRERRLNLTSISLIYPIFRSYPPMLLYHSSGCWPSMSRLWVSGSKRRTWLYAKVGHNNQSKSQILLYITCLDLLIKS